MLETIEYSYQGNPALGKFASLALFAGGESGEAAA